MRDEERSGEGGVQDLSLCLAAMDNFLSIFLFSKERRGEKRRSCFFFFFFFLLRVFTLFALLVVIPPPACLPAWL